MTAVAKAPKVRDTLTLKDSSDLLLAVDAWIEQHVDELELNGGALPDDLAQLLDEIIAAREAKAEAIVFKLDEFGGYATSAKATKDRAARREKVWNNTIAALKAYALREIERAGGAKIKAPSATLRIQTNSAPSTDVRFTDEQLLAFADSGAHPLLAFITVQRVVSIERKALGAAFELRREELVAEAQLFSVSDIPQDVRDMRGLDDRFGYGPGEAEDAEARCIVGENEALEELRVNYVANRLAAEFPGVSVTRGFHLRID